MVSILLCKHQYSLIGREETKKYEDGTYVYLFRCEKCGRTKELEALDLIDRFAHKKLLCLRLKPLHPIYRHPPEASFVFRPFIKDMVWHYYGGFVTRVLRKYARKGIDLREIEKL